MSSVAHLADGMRATFVGNVVNLRHSTYSGGRMCRFDIEDESGKIPCILWNDAVQVFESYIKDGGSYKFYQCQIKNGRDGVEVKIYPDTRVEKCASLRFEKKYDTIDAALLGTGQVRVLGVVYDMSEDIETMKDGAKMRRAMLLDKTGTVSMFAKGDCADLFLSDGSVVKVEGNVSQKNALFATSIVPHEDEELSTYFATVEREPKAKKAKISISSLAEIEKSEVNVKGDFKVVVRTCGIPIVRGAGHKVSMTVVDRSMNAVDLCVFIDNIDATKLPDIGDIISFLGTVSDFNTRSLTTGSFKVDEDDVLRSWWNENQNASFHEVSFDSRGSTSTNA